MIDLNTARDIERTTQKFWDQEIQKPFFKKMAQGKEVGHRIADFIDDKTTGLLAVQYAATFQRNRHGTKLPRSMGDIWLLSGDIYHPINVKSGVSGDNGQPNMVSLKKLLGALLEYQIDSYYLLMIKVARGGNDLSCKIHFVDMLDYLDYMTFDSGPGQVMLRARAFFRDRELGMTPAKRTIHQKVFALVDLLEDGERRLIHNRKTVLRRFRETALRYSESQHIVTSQTQAPLHLQ